MELTDGVNVNQLMEPFRCASVSKLHFTFTSPVHALSKAGASRSGSPPLPRGTARRSHALSGAGADRSGHRTSYILHLGATWSTPSSYRRSHSSEGIW